MLDKGKAVVYNASIYNYVLGIIASVFNYTDCPDDISKGVQQ